MPTAPGEGDDVRVLGDLEETSRISYQKLLALPLSSFPTTRTSKYKPFIRLVVKLLPPQATSTGEPCLLAAPPTNQPHANVKASNGRIAVISDVKLSLVHGLVISLSRISDRADTHLFAHA